MFFCRMIRSALRCILFSFDTPLTASRCHCGMNESAISAPSPLVGSPMTSSATDDLDEENTESSERATAAAGAKTKKKKKKGGCHKLSAASLSLLPSAFSKVGMFIPSHPITCYRRSNSFDV